MKCEICKQGEATQPIFDEQVGKEIWVCTDCDAELFDAGTLQRKVIREIDQQIAHHDQEGNLPAVRSLAHIREFMLNN